MTDRPELTIKEAAKACGVSPKTIRRRLDADTFPNAHRLDGPAGIASGPWVIPIEDLIAADLQPGKPSPPDAAPTPQAPPTIDADPAELERLKLENADLLRRAEVAEALAAGAEAIAAERAQVIRASERTIEAQAQALRMLEAAKPPPAPTTPPDPPQANTDRPRRWYQRRR